MSKLKSLLLIIGVIAAIITIAGCSQPDRQLTTSVVPATGGAISPAKGIFPNGNNVTLIASPAQYYKFESWGGDASGNTNPLTLKMNANKTIVAQFSKITYSIQLSTNPPQGGTIRSSNTTYEAGSNITITATPASGYRFGSWGTDAAGTNNPLTLLADNNKVITANFVKLNTLTVAANPTGGTISPNSGTYDAGATVILTANPVFPYAFENWIGADNNNVNPTNLTMNSDKSISANFVQLTKKTQTPIQKGAHIYNGNGIVEFDLKQYEWVDGTIDCGTFPQVHAYIQGPDGKNMKDFPSIGQASFRFMAPTAGKYSIVVQANFVYGANYNISYTVFGF